MDASGHIEQRPGLGQGILGGAVVDVVVYSSQGVHHVVGQAARLAHDLSTSRVELHDHQRSGAGEHDVSRGGVAAVRAVLNQDPRVRAVDIGTDDARVVPAAWIPAHRVEQPSASGQNLGKHVSVLPGQAIDTGDSLRRPTRL